MAAQISAWVIAETETNALHAKMKHENRVLCAIFFMVCTPGLATNGSICI